MLKEDQLAEMAKRAGIKAEDLKTAITAETEVEVQLPEVVTYLKPDFDTFQTNLKRAGYEEGKVAGVEMAIKEVKTARKLEFEGKTVDALLTHVIDATKKEAGAEPEQRYKNLENKYTQLQQQKETELNLLKLEKDNLSRTLFETRVVDNLTGAIQGDTIIPVKKIAQLFRLENEVVEDNGQLFVKRNGDILKDEKLQPIPAVNIFKELVDKEYLKKGDGPHIPGEEKKDKDGTPLFASQAEWREHFTKKGIPTTSPEASKSFAASKNQTGFKYD